MVITSGGLMLPRKLLDPPAALLCFVGLRCLKQAHRGITALGLMLSFFGLQCLNNGPSEGSPPAAIKVNSRGTESPQKSPGLRNLLSNSAENPQVDSMFVSHYCQKSDLPRLKVKEEHEDITTQQGNNDRKKPKLIHMIVLFACIHISRSKYVPNTSVMFHSSSQKVGLSRLFLQI